MKTISQNLKTIVENAVKEKFSLQSDPEISRTKQASFGDYQTNIALILSKQLSKSPKEIATCLLPLLKGDPIAKVEIAGPGFINFFLDNKTLIELTDLPFCCQDSMKGRVIVDYSSPNIAKDLHVGHLRSTLIGDSIARLYEYLGYDVLKLNHVGDFGTQFGMLIAYLIEEKIDISSASLLDLMGWYRVSKKRFDDDEKFRQKSQKEVVALQNNEPLELSLWQSIVAISRQGFQEIYNILDVNLIERGESFYQPYLKKIVDEAIEKGVATLSEGAKCIFLEGYLDQDKNPLPLIIQKKDGGFNYATTDLAALRHRIEEEKGEKIIYVIDAGQSLHLNQVFDAAQKIGFYDPHRVEVRHAPFGLVLNPDGTKMKTRSGENKRLVDLIYEGIRRAQKEVMERRQDLTPEEIEELSTILGVNAIKYADLSSVRTKDYVFSYERMLKFEGNTASYLLYSYVRMKGIVKKAKKRASKIALTDPNERALYLHLLQFPEWLQSIEKDLLPHRLADYLYQLAELVNLFYNHCPVDGSKEEESRLKLVEMVLAIFETGFFLLGLKTIEKM